MVNTAILKCMPLFSGRPSTEANFRLSHGDGSNSGQCVYANL